MTSRIDIIGQNGNDGEHYDEPIPKAPAGTLVSHSVVNGYRGLFYVLVDALDQAQLGKGAERHAGGEAFEDQPMQKLIELSGD